MFALAASSSNPPSAWCWCVGRFRVPPVPHSIPEFAGATRPASCATFGNRRQRAKGVACPQASRPGGRSPAALPPAQSV